MPRWTIRLAVVAALTVALAAPSGGQETSAQVDAAWVRAMKANDVDAVVKCYAPDAVLWLPGAPAARGEQAIRAAYEALLAANTVRDASLSEVREKSTLDGAVRWGTFALTLGPRSGEAPVVVTGRFTEILERRESRWMYVVDHASADPPPVAGTK
jgi:uncharacterized protein (TIGR02246 family)